MQHQIGIRIAGTELQFPESDDVRFDKRTAAFLTDASDCDWLCTFRPAEHLHVSEKLIYKAELFEAYAAPKGESIRKYIDPLDGNSDVAVIRCRAAEKTVQVQCSAKSFQHFFTKLENRVDFLCIEWLLMQECKMMLHASCVDTKLGGILFTGPSGIGKSTQASLWCRYQNADLINGDKTILVKENHSWYGWGSPFAGSSNCYRNQKVKIRAIVVLKQEQSCSLRKLERKAAFQKLFSQMTANPWDREFMERAVDFTVNLSAEVPIYELACTPTPDAVELLRSELEKAGEDHG